MTASEVQFFDVPIFNVKFDFTGLFFDVPVFQVFNVTVFSMFHFTAFDITVYLLESISKITRNIKRHPVIRKGVCDCVTRPFLALVLKSVTRVGGQK